MSLEIITEKLFQGFEMYRQFNASYPVAGAALTAIPTFAAGEMIAQAAKDRKIDWRRVGYVASQAPAYGIGCLALLQTGYAVERYISSNPLAMAALGPNLFGPLLMDHSFYVNNAVGRENGYSITGLAKHYASIFTDGVGNIARNVKEKYIAHISGREYLIGVGYVATVWNAIQWANYSVVPEDLRAPVVLGAGVLWQGVRSLLSLTSEQKKQES